MIWGISFSVGNVIFFDMVGKFLDFFLGDFGGCGKYVIRLEFYVDFLVLIFLEDIVYLGYYFG